MRYNDFEYIDISDKQHCKYKEIIRLESKLSSESKIVDECMKALYYLTPYLKEIL